MIFTALIISETAQTYFINRSYVALQWVVHHHSINPWLQSYYCLVLFHMGQHLISSDFSKSTQMNKLDPKQTHISDKDLL